jgi:hypothetical protein
MHGNEKQKKKERLKELKNERQNKGSERERK